MSDEHDAAKGTGRPVEPLVIDVEAESAGEDPAHEQATETATETGKNAPGRAPGGARAGRLLLAVGAVVLIAGAGLWGLSASGFRFTRDDGRVAALTQRIEILETTLSAMSESVTEFASRDAEIKSALDKVAGQAPPGLDEVKSRMDTIEGALQSAQAAIEAAGKAASGAAMDGGEVALLTGRIDELQQKLAALEKAGSAATEAQQAQEAKGGELAAALVSLDTPLHAGRPFTAELEKVAAIAPGLTGIEELKPHAATGVPSVADLAHRLQAIAERETAAPAASQAVGGEGLWTGLRSRISNLVTVRDLGKARWIDGTAVAARQAGQGDIQQAVATLQAIEGPPPEELRAWLAEAQARAALDRVAQTVAEAARKEAAGTP